MHFELETALPKRRRPPATRSAAPTSLRYSPSRAAAQLAPCGAQTVLADFPRLACVARRSTRGRSKPSGHYRSLAQWRLRIGSGPALCVVEQRRAQREKGRGLFEPRRGEFRSPPLRPSSAEHPAQPGDAAGANFLWLLSFGKTKESSPPSGRNPTSQHQTMRQKRNGAFPPAQMHEV